jgi:hypothetical protein
MSMGRRGRKRKIVHREGNGRAKRSQEVKVIAETTVLGQPHRRGNTDQRCATVFGQFCLAQRLHRNLYLAGEEYAGVTRRWRSAKGIPTPYHNEAAGTGRGPSDETVQTLTRRMVEMEQAMMGAGVKALLAVKQLTLDGNPLGMDQDSAAVDGLMALGVHLGMMSARTHPFERAA